MRKEANKQVKFNARVITRHGYLRKTRQGPPCPCCGQPLPEIEVPYDEALSFTKMELILAVERDLKQRGISDTGLFKIVFKSAESSALGSKITAEASESVKDGVLLSDALAFAHDLIQQLRGAE